MKSLATRTIAKESDGSLSQLSAIFTEEFTMLYRHLNTQLLRIFCLLFICTSASVSSAAGSLIKQGYTGINSSSGGVISYQHQDHFWETADRTKHLLVNKGADAAPNSLVLMMLRPNARQWVEAFALPGTDETSSADVLTDTSGSYVSMIYTDAAGAVYYTRNQYGIPNTGQWQEPYPFLVYDGVDGAASAPTMAALTILHTSSYGAFATFMVKDHETGIVQAHLYASQASSHWQDTGRRWNTADTGEAKAARVVAFQDRLGILYTDTYTDGSGQLVSTLRWAKSPPGYVDDFIYWTDQLVYEAPTDGKDTFGSNFSLVMDNHHDLHLLLTVGNRVRYLRHGVDWAYSKWMFPFEHGASYAQISQEYDDRLFAVLNLGSYLVVMESLDDGFTFNFDSFLPHPKRPGENWRKLKIETPRRFSGFFDVFQEFSTGRGEGAGQSLYHHQVLY